MVQPHGNSTALPHEHNIEMAAGRKCRKTLHASCAFNNHALFFNFRKTVKAIDENLITTMFDNVASVYNLQSAVNLRDLNYCFHDK